MPRLILSLAIIAILAAAALAADPAATPSPLPTATAPAAAAPSSVLAAPAKPAEPSIAERRTALAADIQDINIRYLGSLDPAVREQGRRKLLEIRDPAAVEPLVKILGVGGDDMKQIACQVLGQIPDEEAARQLAKYALAEAGEGVRLAAVKGIKTRSDRLALQFLLNGLKGQGEPVKRAAYALGECADYPAALAMLAYLRRLETREVEVTVTDSQPGFFSGTTQAYVAGSTAVVGGGVAVQKPIIGYTGSGTGVGSTPGTDDTHVEKRPFQAWAEQPMILEALKKITGQDFEYRTEDWRKWLKKAIDEEKAAERGAAAPKEAPIPPPATSPTKAP